MPHDGVYGRDRRVWSFDREYYMSLTGVVSLSAGSQAETILDGLQAFVEGVSALFAPVEMLHARRQVPYAPLVVPDLLALLLDSDPELFVRPVAVLRWCFARHLELL
jgi:hypothetical protein